MAAGDVERLIRSRNDSAGNAIREFYACNAPLYAVYRTDTRVLIEFADFDTTEKDQRRALAPLGPLRSEINALINGWRGSSAHHKLAKARAFDRRTADALVMALEDDVANGTRELMSVRNEIIDGRKSTARFMYLVVAFAFALFVCLLADILSLPGLGLCTAWSGAGDVMNAIVGGAIGAFFSIATGLSKRTILTDLQQRDNALDATLRMVIGVISAGIFVCLLESKIVVGLTLGSIDDRWMQYVTLGFLAGFSERLVPDLLAKAGAAVEAIPLPPKEAARAPVPTDQLVAKGSQQTPAVPSAPTVDDGDCCSDTPLTEAEATPDAALPPAAGGTQ